MFFFYWKTRPVIKQIQHHLTREIKITSSWKEMVSEFPQRRHQFYLFNKVEIVFIILIAC